jgi:hypothetical protein
MRSALQDQLTDRGSCRPDEGGVSADTADGPDWTACDRRASSAFCGSPAAKIPIGLTRISAPFDWLSDLERLPTSSALMPITVVVPMSNGPGFHHET